MGGAGINALAVILWHFAAPVPITAENLVGKWQMQRYVPFSTAPGTSILWELKLDGQFDLRITGDRFATPRSEGKWQLHGRVIKSNISRPDPTVRKPDQNIDFLSAKLLICSGQASPDQGAMRYRCLRIDP